MKKLLLSGSILLAVAAVVIGATTAFFSDTETSTGNTFTAGDIDLKVDSTSHYDGLICVAGLWQLEPGQTPQTAGRPDLIGKDCGGTWALKDLLPGTDKFFNFADVKPGDSGENTISLHVGSNNAWACADLTNIHNDDNSITEPELGAGDTDIAPGLGTGDLGQGLDFLVWNDNGTNNENEQPCNNVWDANEVGTNTSGGAPLSSHSYTLADSSTGVPVTGDTTSCLGIAWCAGTFTAGGPGIAPVCDGSTMGNIAQTDSYAADIALRVVQSRNNGSFVCQPPLDQLEVVGGE